MTAKSTATVWQKTPKRPDGFHGRNASRRPEEGDGSVIHERSMASAVCLPAPWTVFLCVLASVVAVLRCLLAVCLLLLAVCLRLASIGWRGYAAGGVRSRHGLDEPIKGRRREAPSTGIGRAGLAW